MNKPYIPSVETVQTLSQHMTSISNAYNELKKESEIIQQRLDSLRVIHNRVVDVFESAMEVDRYDKGEYFTECGVNAIAAYHQNLAKFYLREGDSMYAAPLWTAVDSISNSQKNFVTEVYALKDFLLKQTVDNNPV